MQEDSLLQACMRTIQQQTFYQTYWKTFKVVEADTPELREQAFRLRYQVYSIDPRFEGESADPAAMEKDAYDDRAIHHLMIHEASGQTVGTVRVLLPKTSNPLDSFEMQKQVKHPLLENQERSQHICEISRLCMAPAFRKRPGDGRVLPAYSEQETGDFAPLGRAFIRRRITYAPLGLIGAAFETAMDRGILDIISMMDPADFRSLKRLGMPYKILGSRVNTAQVSLQPIIYNIKNVLDNMEQVNPECWEILADKGRLSHRATEIQMNSWNTAIFDETAKAGFMSRLF